MIQALESEVFSMKKRLTALLLLMCMLLTMVPIGAWADTDSGGEAAVHSDDGDDSCDHDWVKETCTTERCSKCNETRTAPSPSHAWGNWASDETTHTRFCTVSGCDASQSGSHDYSSWVSSGDKHTKKCKDCGQEVSADHNWGTAWVPNGDGTHSHVCSDCGAKSTPVSCQVGTPATCFEPAKCQDCGGSIGTASNVHSGTPTYTPIGNDTHRIRYSGCGHTVEEKCSGGTASCDKKAVCALCGAEYGEVHHEKADKPRQVTGEAAHEDYCKLCGESMGNKVACTQTPKSKANGTHDIVCSVCDAVLVSCAKCSYDPKTAVCSRKPVCQICGVEYGEILGHDLDGNGVCQRPGCDCTHPHVWEGVSASAVSAKCPDCGKSVDKKKLTVEFTVTGFGVGKSVGDLKATANSSNVTDMAVSASPDGGTFRSGTSYTITVSYKVADGYLVSGQTINGKAAGSTSGSAQASMGTPEKLYKITYSGINDASLPAEYSASSLPLTLPDVSKNGYIFKGWSGKGVTKNSAGITTIAKGTTGNLIITSNWEVQTYTVTFYLDSGDAKAYREYQVKYNHRCPTPPKPTADAEIFDGWAKDGTAYNFEKAVTESFTLTATWKPAGYIYYHNASGKQIVAEQRAYKLPKATKSGYYFCGWYSDSTLEEPVSKVDVVQGETVHVYAKWKRVDPTNPKTGDRSHPELAFGIFALSTVSLGAVTVVSKKKRFF